MLQHEPTLAVPPKDCQWPTFAAADYQILVTIAVEIKPGDSRTSLARFAGQERLSREVVKGVIMMHVMKPISEILKKGLGRSELFGPGSQGLGVRLGNFVEIVRRGVFHRRFATRPPMNVKLEVRVRH